MSESLADRQLLMAVLAAHLGFVSEETACDAIAAAQVEQDTSLGGQLDSIGKLSSRQIRLLEDLADERMAHSAQPVWEWCAAQISPRFLQVLSGRGLESSAEQLFQASSATEQTGTFAQDKSLIETAQAENTPSSKTPASSAGDFEVTQASAPSLPPGRYRIVRELAQGGLGTVSVAEDVPLEREVAFKEIRPEKSSDERSQARFLIEAQITGRLEHPSIVPVYDVGARESGQPFYVMRLIRGESMKDVLNRFYGNTKAGSETGKTDDDTQPKARRERNIEFRDLLSRFVDVCQAVAYAHQHGVIHRDLKPANIMLGKFGETLLVDWGLAKVLASGETSEPDDLTTAYTESASPNLTIAGTAIGTPSFMSPEQANGDIERISTSSDIYGLGATLFSIITGRRPVSGSSTAEVMQRVRDGQLEVHESASPANVPPALWAICRKAMQTSQRDRYDSATDLMRDVERYLADEPVSALREPMFSRARRWIRHHSTVVSTASAICLMAIVSLSIGLTVYAGLSNRLETTNGQLANSNTQLEDANTQLTQTNGRLETSIAAEQQARTEAESRLFLAVNSVETYLSAITDNVDLQRPDLRQLRRSLLSNAIPFFEQLRQQAEGNAEVEFMRGKASIRLSAIHDELANGEQARAEIAQAIEILQAVSSKHPQNADYLFHLAVAQNNQGTLLMNAGQFSESREALEATLETRDKMVGLYPDVVTMRRDRARTLTNLAILRSDDADYEAAIEIHQQAIELRRQNLEATESSAESIFELANSYQNLGIAFSESQQDDAAMESFQTGVELYAGSLESLLARYEWTLGYASLLNNLGSSHYRRGELAQSRETRQRTLDVFRELQKSYPYVPQVQWGLANALVEQALIISETEPQADFLTPGEEALQIYSAIESVYGDDFRFLQDIVHARYNVGNLLQMRGQTDRAREQFLEAISKLETLIGPLPEGSNERLNLRSKLADVRSSQADTLSYSGDHASAADLYAEVALEREFLGTRLPDKITHLGGQADALHNASIENQAAQRIDAARDGFAKALAVREELLETYPNNTYLLSQQATTHNGLAVLLGNLQLNDECREQYEKCLALCEHLIALRADYYMHARITAAGAISNLASLERRVGNIPKAVERYAQAVESLEATLVEQPGEPTASKFLGITLQGRAEMRDHEGQFAAAAEDWNRAAEVADPIYFSFYKLCEGQSLAQAGEVDKAVALAQEHSAAIPDFQYLGAKVHALAAGQTDDETKRQSFVEVAITALQQLEQSGFLVPPTHLDELKTSATWETLREDDRFAELLERLGADTDGDNGGSVGATAGQVNDMLDSR